MQIKDRLKEIEGKKIWIDQSSYGILIRYPYHDGRTIKKVTGDSIVLSDGTIIAIAAIASIEPDI